MPLLHSNPDTSVLVYVPRCVFDARIHLCFRSTQHNWLLVHLRPPERYQKRGRDYWLRDRSVSVIDHDHRQRSSFELPAAFRSCTRRWITFFKMARSCQYIPCHSNQSNDHTDNHQVDPKTRVPAHAIIVTAGFVCVVSLIEVRSTVPFNAILSLASTAMMGTYLLSIGIHRCFFTAQARSLIENFKAMSPIEDYTVMPCRVAAGG